MAKINRGGHDNLLKDWEMVSLEVQLLEITNSEIEIEKIKVRNDPSRPL